MLVFLTETETEKYKKPKLKRKNLQKLKRNWNGKKQWKTKLKLKNISHLKSLLKTWLCMDYTLEKLASQTTPEHSTVQ